MNAIYGTSIISNKLQYEKHTKQERVVESQRGWQAAAYDARLIFCGRVFTDKLSCQHVVQYQQRDQMSK